MDPDRARILSFAPPVDGDPDRDLYEGPAPVTQPSRKTGANDLPLGSRNRQTSYEEFKFDPYNYIPPAWAFVELHPCRRITREFAKCTHSSLIDYLVNRNISLGFLAEIDLFLRSHANDIEKYAPGGFAPRINELSPLDAYLYFINGYIRPARYNHGIITNRPIFPRGFRPPSLRLRRDKELDDFMRQLEYGVDTIDCIDRAVILACRDIDRGVAVSPALGRLVSYAVFGNPVDAYKYYHFNYQTDFMSHRSKLDHKVLEEVPKPDDYTEPQPSVLNNWNNHRDIRDQMARAKDQGVGRSSRVTFLKAEAASGRSQVSLEYLLAADVIKVLLNEYRLILVKKGLRRIEIDSLCVQAQVRIDSERTHPQGVDIVDMVMDDAFSR